MGDYSRYVALYRQYRRMLSEIHGGTCEIAALVFGVKRSDLRKMAHDAATLHMQIETAESRC